MFGDSKRWCPVVPLSVKIAGLANDSFKIRNAWRRSAWNVQESAT
jgi:hypothetical protein